MEAFVVQWIQSGFKVDLKRIQRGFKVDSKWTQNSCKLLCLVFNSFKFFSEPRISRSCTHLAKGLITLTL